MGRRDVVFDKLLGAGSTTLHIIEFVTELRDPHAGVDNLLD